ncbi:hypothetical protein [Actinophytocola sp.]|uniref:hypothetical protein n=1 Tax=Actinophytocola sp. TaxID=1872138 RepID=UPI002D321E6C|nr:hypothetical protein [Actinophytocola sp.]HYQ64532.1 hypothetical protein [Actinophytocola sp.]
MTTVPEPPIAHAPPRRNLVPYLIAALVLAVGAVVALVIVLTSSDDDPAANSVTINGSMKMGYGDITRSGSDCSGRGGYDDIHEGTDVTVYDDTGKIVGASELTGSSYGASDSSCTWFFQVKVQGGHDFYQVEVSHRGKITVSAAEAKSRQVALTLGD